MKDMLWMSVVMPFRRQSKRNRQSLRDKAERKLGMQDMDRERSWDDLRDADW